MEIGCKDITSQKPHDAAAPCPKHTDYHQPNKHRPALRINTEGQWQHQTESRGLTSVISA